MSAATEPWAPRGQLGPPFQTTTNQTTSGTTTKTLVTGSRTVSQGRRYQIVADFPTTLGDTVADRYQINLNAAGASLKSDIRTVDHLTRQPGRTLIATYDPVADGSVTFTLTATRVTGTGTITFEAASAGGGVNPIEITVKDDGLQ